jgi:uncharacterized membrane protein
MIRRAMPLLATVVLVHVLAVWSIPYIIMLVLMDGPAARALEMQNRAVFPPPVSAKVRTVVMPSPDLLYSVCVYDLSTGPVHISANPGLPSYWSIALYGANSDNFFVVNDRKAAGKPVDLLLVSGRDGTMQDTAANGSNIVVSPSVKGFLLMRVLTSDYASEKTVVEPARRTLVCQKI